MMSDYDIIKDTNVIAIPQGSNYSDKVICTQTTGAAFDLTGYECVSQLRSVGGTLVGTFTCTIDADPTTGIIYRSLTPLITAALTPSLQIVHVWGAELTAADGTILPEIQGGAMITKEVVKVVA